MLVITSLYIPSSHTFNSYDNPLRHIANKHTLKKCFKKFDTDPEGMPRRMVGLNG